MAHLRHALIPRDLPPPNIQNATYADIRQPVHSRPLGSGAEALCITASSSGNVLAVGGRHGTIQVWGLVARDQRNRSQ